jgi:hypothetical protein
VSNFLGHRQFEHCDYSVDWLSLDRLAESNPKALREVHHG